MQLPERKKRKTEGFYCLEKYIFVHRTYIINSNKLGEKTYFDGTVEVIMEALSRVKAEHLNLEQRRGSRTERKGKILEILPLIAASATI